MASHMWQLARKVLGHLHLSMAPRAGTGATGVVRQVTNNLASTRKCTLCSALLCSQRKKPCQAPAPRHPSRSISYTRWRTRCADRVCDVRHSEDDMFVYCEPSSTSVPGPGMDTRWSTSAVTDRPGVRVRWHGRRAHSAGVASRGKLLGLPASSRGVQPTNTGSYPGQQMVKSPLDASSRVQVHSLSRPTSIEAKLAGGVPAHGEIIIVRLGLACFAVVFAAASATQFRVGGQKGWTVPDAGFEPYNTWAGRLRFQIGDQLLEPAAYNACNTSSYVNKFDDGNTVFTFDHSGPFFFISGNESSSSSSSPTAPRGCSAHHVSTVPGALPEPILAASCCRCSGDEPVVAATLQAVLHSSSGSHPDLAAFSGDVGSRASDYPGLATGATHGADSTPGGTSQPPSASANAPGGGGSGSTTPPPPSAAAPVVTGLVGSLIAFVATP
ncbi:hypothetical protein HU200_008465 [Digitaria exilis]|uniref:Phytocyanin domain-containing protein n=1 Tax=Digitaria exilis TaxID=1010633 RepID=A0A835FLR7_9POAL|nr:hypothetical protein HU200_008465 [Digitaria exilis]